MFVVSPYDLDGQISMSAFSRLEAAGISVLASLARFRTQIATRAGVSDSHSGRTYTGIERLELMVSEWVAGKWNLLPPTWRSLFEIMDKLGLEEISHQIDRNLSCK